jgi:hypothetical protein
VTRRAFLRVIRKNPGVEYDGLAEELNLPPERVEDLVLALKAIGKVEISEAGTLHVIDRRVRA